MLCLRDMVYLSWPYLLKYFKGCMDLLEQQSLLSYLLESPVLVSKFSLLCSYHQSYLEKGSGILFKDKDYSEH